jgi:hypothetical protein
MYSSGLPFALPARAPQDSRVVCVWSAAPPGRGARPSPDPSAPLGPGACASHRARDLCTNRFDYAKLHVQAGAYLSRPWPFKVLAKAMWLAPRKWPERLLAQQEGRGGRSWRDRPASPRGADLREQLLGRTPEWPPRKRPAVGGRHRHEGPVAGSPDGRPGHPWDSPGRPRVATRRVPASPQPRQRVGGTARAPGAPKPPGLEPVREAIRMRHSRMRTAEAEVSGIKRLILVHGQRHPPARGAAELTQGRAAVAGHGQVRASTPKHARWARLFLSRHVRDPHVGWATAPSPGGVDQASGHRPARRAGGRPLAHGQPLLWGRAAPAAVPARARKTGARGCQRRCKSRWLPIGHRFATGTSTPWRKASAGALCRPPGHGRRPTPTAPGAGRMAV